MKKLLKSSFSVLLALAICASMLVGLNITASAESQKVATFALGANGSASHNDGSNKTSYSETNNNYTLSLTSGTQFYTGARDAKGNSAIKLGSSKSVGSFKMNVPADVTSVVFKVAQYKANATKISVGGQTHTISTASTNGAYTDITVDTTTTKSLTFTTVSGGVRCMINTIEFYAEVSSGDEGFEITATSNNEDYGTVEVSGDTIVATPKTGYKVAGHKITSGSANVTQNGNVFTVEATEDVSITINFVALAQYTVTFQEAGNEYTQTVYEDSKITLPYHKGAMGAGVTFSGWTANDTSYTAGAAYTVNGDVTFAAKYGTTTAEHSATIKFDNTIKRTEFTTNKQVWQENGVILTNNKSSSTNPMGDYYNPVRFYKDSTVTIAYAEAVSKIVLIADSSDYAAVFKNSITDVNATVTVSGTTVTVTLTNPVTSITTGKLTAKSFITSITVYPAPPAATGAITGAQVSIGDDISIDFFAEIENLGDNEPQMKFTLGDDDAVIVTDYYIDGDKYVFNFATDVENRKGIAPQRMSDIIVAELIVDGEVIATKDNYSIKSNAQNLLEDYADNDEMVALVSDMLNYGAAAQKYRGYNLDNLATDGVEGLVISTNAPEESDMDLTASTGDACFKSASIYFADANYIVVKVKDYTENTKLLVDENPVEMVDGVYMTDAIEAIRFGEVFSFQLVENDVVIQTLEYSVNSYAFSKQNSETMGELALALYNYGLSAEAYFLSMPH